MKNIIACKPKFYKLPLGQAAAELKKIGITNLEVSLPPNGRYEPIFRAAAEQDVKVTSFGAGLTVGDPESFRTLEKAITAAEQYGVGIIFSSVSLPEGALHRRGIDELKKLGAMAADAGTVISIETHKPYAHNAAVAAETIEAVDSPGVGYNYDTANIYYYNERGIDAVAELRKAVAYVTSVHLKESAAGEPGQFDFPVFGTGVVRFKEIFGILAGKGFHGPYTMELEGPVVDGLSVGEKNQKVKACLDHLRSIGAIA